MGSKRSVKIKKISDVDPLEKNQDLETKKLQQARMSWKLKYELINSDQYSNGTNDGGKASSEEEESASDAKTSSETEAKKTEVKRKETKQKTTVIAGLSGYLSSSDSDEDSSDQDTDINCEVRAFLKEVDSIKLDDNGHPIEESKKEEQKPTSEAAAMDQQQQAMREYYAAHGYSMPTTSWQECYDSSTGYSYYWNMETNEVRWEIPAEYQSYIANVKQQWEDYHRALYRNQYNNTVLNQSAAVINKTTASSHTSLQAINSSSLHTEHKTENVNSSSNLRRRPNAAQAKSEPQSGVKKRRPPNMSDSEDEKIELITSYGPNSDDQSSEDEKDPSNPNKSKRRKSRHSQGSKDNTDRPYKNSKLSHVPDKGPPGVEDDSEEIEKQEEIRKRIASRQEDMKKLLALKKEEALKKKKRMTDAQNEGPNKKKQAVDTNSVISVTGSSSEESQDIPKIAFKPDIASDVDVPSPGEAELVERLKSQAEVLKKLGGELPEGVTRIISEQLTKPEPKADGSLVAGYDEGANSEMEEDKDLLESVKTILGVESAKLESKEPLPKTDEMKEETSKTELKAAAGERVSKKILKLSAKAKKLINASETTKRARQTDFIDTPLGLRPASSTVDDKCSVDGSEITSTESNSSVELMDKVKSLVPITGNESGAEIEDYREFDIKDNSELLLSKMKFLSEGKESPSPVQIWVEQLEILMKAWEEKYLKSEFLSHWLQSLGERLTQLESSAAPLGWLCLWSREERRYSYKKIETGEVVWEFPEDNTIASTCTAVEETAAVVTRDTGEEECLDLGEGQGEVEMEICLTPPPPPSPPSPPPPPSISDRPPSPPPPPIISFSSDASLPEEAPPLPDETPPPLPEEAPPPLPEEAPPLPLEEAPPLPPGEPLPPGVELPGSNSSFTPSLPPVPQPVPPPSVPLPPPIQTSPLPVPHRALLPHPPPQVQSDYGHLALPPAPYHMGYHQVQYASHSQYSSAFVSAAPMPAQIPPKATEEEKKGDMTSELDSFYNDLAKLEPEESEEQLPDTCPPIALPQIAEDINMDIHSQDSPDPQPPTSSSPDPAALKKKKKPKLAPGLALKKKGVSSLVAKWQKVQQNALRDF